MSDAEAAMRDEIERALTTAGTIAATLPLRRIDTIWAAVSLDPKDNTEGVCAVEVNGMLVPLIAADEERLPWVIEQATKIARSTLIRIKLIKLHNREELMTIEGVAL